MIHDKNLYKAQGHVLKLINSIFWSSFLPVNVYLQVYKLINTNYSSNLYKIYTGLGGYCV
jgi:hypothetical protein